MKFREAKDRMTGHSRFKVDYALAVTSLWLAASTEMGCASTLPTHRGASPGALKDGQVRDLLSSLRTLPPLDPERGVVTDETVAPTNPMTLYYGSSADPSLVDLVYFIEAPDDFQHATVRASMIRKENQRPMVLAEEQN